MRRLLLISNSTQYGSGYLEHCEKEILDFLAGTVQEVLFVPYALHDLDAYAATARSGFGRMGIELQSVHEAENPAAAVREAQALFIGGGNTFRLLNRLYEEGLLDPIRERSAAGMPYIGTSAGSNVACKSIRTTNDMPIVYPPSFDALQLAPFQLNPHYIDPDTSSTHMGETRETRIREFHEVASDVVIGIREGVMLRVEGDSMELRGSHGGVAFSPGKPVAQIADGADLSWALT